MTPRRWIPCAALALACLAGPAPAQGGLSLQPCGQPGLPPDARCGSLVVPENRDVAGGRTIALNVVVLPARAARRAPDAVTFLAGGPGQAVLSLVGWLGPAYAPLRETRDILLVDARGTGGSGPLDCTLHERTDPQSLVGSFLPADAVRRCREQLSARADLSRYTLAEAARDLDAVRAALGYEQLNLHGGSFGTRAAQVYMRMYPHRVRSAVLHGVVTPGMASPQSYAHDFQAALNGVIADCAADAACGAAFPRLADEARALEERMRRGSATATLLDVEAGAVQVELSRGTVAETLRKLLYAPVSAGRLPLVVHRAAHGDFGLLAREAIGDRRRMQGGASWGLFLAVTCSEDVPFVDTAAARATDATTLLGAYRVREAVAACEGWPKAALPPGYRDPVRSAAPVLIISGERDPVTGPRWGEAIAAHLPNSVHLVVPQAAHMYAGMPGAACVDSAVITFVRHADPRAVDTTCLPRVRRPPWVLEAETTLVLDSAALGRFAGEYSSPEPAMRMTVEARPGGLRAQLGNGPPLYLLSTSPTRFYPEGWPPGATVEFVLDDGAVAQVLITGGGPPMRLVPARRP